MNTLIALVALCFSSIVYYMCKHDDPRPLVPSNKTQFKNSFLLAVQNSKTKEVPYRKRMRTV